MNTPPPLETAEFPVKTQLVNVGLLLSTLIIPPPPFESPTPSALLLVKVQLVTIGLLK